MKYFKAEAEGDVLYFKAKTLLEAKRKFVDMMGDVPDSILTWTEVEELPDGFESIEA